MAVKTVKKTKAKAAAKPASRPAKAVAAQPAATRTASVNYQELLARKYKGDLMLGSLFAEMIGTFILTAAVLATSGNIIIAALTVLVLVIVLSQLTSVHLNPAITLAMLVTKQITVGRAAGYLVAQFFGAMLALAAITQLVASGAPNPLTGQVGEVFHVEKLVGDWRPFFTELVGALVFGFGVASVAMGKKQGIDAAFAVGGTLLLGLLIAAQASSSIINPAVAAGVNAYETGNMWTVWVYGLAPIIGAAAGAWLYKLLQWDVLGSKKA